MVLNRKFIVQRHMIGDESQQTVSNAWLVVNLNTVYQVRRAAGQK